jgi:hypothetical protein
VSSAPPPPPPPAPPASPARVAHSADDYERRLRAAMRLMAGKDRDAVAKEIRTGIDAQVAAAGGAFARVAPSLDDPAWVGRQMERVYGVAAWVKALALIAVAGLALASVPGVVAQPADSPGAIAAALGAFALLVVLLFASAMRVSWVTSGVGGGAAALMRIAAFALPLGGASALETATGGEVALFMVATALLVVVAVVPASVRRSRTDGE